MMSLPTIALVYIVRLAGSFFGLPDSFPVLGAQGLAFICIAVSDSWFIECAIYRRLDSSLHDRYSLQDFVRFARSKGIVRT